MKSSTRQPQPMISTRQLRRVYPAGRGSREVVALDGLDLDIAAGETHGLLGPNGAGKTTLVKILSTILTSTGGTASVGGWDVSRHPQRVRAEIGLVLGGDRGLYTRLSARQNLRFWAAAARLDRRSIRRRSEELIEQLGLTDWADQPVEKFSRGMKQRLHLARGLVGDPPVLILDEPTAGMDPIACHEFRELVQQLRAEGKTTLLATHDMVEADQLCDRVTLVDHGRALFCESTREVGRLLGGLSRVEFSHTDDTVASTLSAVTGVVAVRLVRVGHWVVDVEGDARYEVPNLLLAAGVRNFVSGPPSLEQVYLTYVGQRGMKL